MIVGNIIFPWKEQVVKKNKTQIWNIGMNDSISFHGSTKMLTKPPRTCLGLGNGCISFWNECFLGDLLWIYVVLGLNKPLGMQSDCNVCLEVAAVYVFLVKILCSWYKVRETAEDLIYNDDMLFLWVYGIAFGWCYFIRFWMLIAHMCDVFALENLPIDNSSSTDSCGLYKGKDVGSKERMEP